MKPTRIITLGLLLIVPGAIPSDDQEPAVRTAIRAFYKAFDDGFVAPADYATEDWNHITSASSQLDSGVGCEEYNRTMMNMTRRDTLAGAIALLCELSAAELQTRARVAGRTPAPKIETEPATQPQAGERSGANLVFKHDLPNLTMDDWEVTVSTVDYAPGRVGKVHHHAGFVLAYVLEGNVVTKISGQEERTYRAGEMFFEPPGSTHEVSRNASETQPAKLLAMIFAKKGVSLTMPGPA